MAGDFVGAGLSFPLRLSASGGVRLVAHVQEIEQSMRIILSTAPGERVMRPEFGCAVHDLVFAGTDATTAGRLDHAVRRALDRWEPRIDVQDIAVSVDPEGNGLVVAIRYAIRATNDVRNLVFPFYTLPREDRP